MTLLSDLEEFVADHRPHGTMAGDATAPAVDCPCGVVFERWITTQEADLDLMRLALRN